MDIKRHDSATCIRLPEQATEPRQSARTEPPTEQEWENLQRDLDPFHSLTEYVYGPETRPDALQARSLTRWEMTIPYCVEFYERHARLRAKREDSLRNTKSKLLSPLNDKNKVGKPSSTSKRSSTGSDCSSTSSAAISLDTFPILPTQFAALVSPESLQHLQPVAANQSQLVTNRDIQSTEALHINQEEVSMAIGHIMQEDSWMEPYMKFRVLEKSTRH